MLSQRTTHRANFEHAMSSKSSHVHENVVKARVLPVHEVAAVLASEKHYSDNVYDHSDD
jgi:hypothetical protein